ncbi:hypothetical protein [Sporosarcina gallistercoris]|uniref:Uncharacterized protein n=1 Tax=Sporosarcina gallistercoris TaxID=2762245 RepID=A0ABR8PK55_9BACL|nr:hypothetical protein [Sporosarcina gallistercoris]MBD7908570.1 hypothetical protein [Sporosarcina gallistercoris]
MSEVLLQQILSELKDVKSGQRKMEECFDKMQTPMDGMKGQMDGMKGQMDEMQGQLNRIENKQDAIFEQTGQLAEFRQETLTKFDDVVKKEDMQYLEFKVMEHDRDLFNLKKRA